MKHESTYEQLLRLLDAAKGLHARMAKETGVSQAAVSRTFRRESVPSVVDADLMIAWLKRPGERPAARKRPSAGARSTALLTGAGAIGIGSVRSGVSAAAPFAE